MSPVYGSGVLFVFVRLVNFSESLLEVWQEPMIVDTSEVSITLISRILT